MALCLSVRPSVRLSQAGTVSKRLDRSSWFRRRGFFGLIATVGLYVIRKFWYLQK